MRKPPSICLALVWAVFVGGAEPLAACANKATAIGVSRIIEIDSTGGPQIGRSQTVAQAPLLLDGEVVLTFDDGPHPQHTRSILDALDEHCTKATFFMIGRSAASYPAIVQEVAQRGHTLANHTWSHAALPLVSLPRAIKEIDTTFGLLERVLGRPATRFFRFPGLAEKRTLRSYLQTNAIATFGADIDPRDWAPGTSEADVVNRVLQGLAIERKGVILLHDIQPHTMRATGPLLSELLKRRFRVVHLVAKSVITRATVPARQ